MHAVFRAARTPKIGRREPRAPTGRGLQSRVRRAPARRAAGVGTRSLRDTPPTRARHAPRGAARAPRTHVKPCADMCNALIRLNIFFRARRLRQPIAVPAATCAASRSVSRTSRRGAARTPIRAAWRTAGADRGTISGASRAKKSASRQVKKRSRATHRETRARSPKRRHAEPAGHLESGTRVSVQRIDMASAAARRCALSARASTRAPRRKLFSRERTRMHAKRWDFSTT